MACGIIRQLGIMDEKFDVVLSGSLFKGSPILQNALKGTVIELAPCARFVYITAPPVTCAVMMAMDKVDFDYVSISQRIIETGELLFVNSN
jgi:hypothetical protein